MQEWVDICVARVLASFQGMIVMWSGVLANIPDGWALCDGTQGTPDLSKKFIRAADEVLDPHQTGGGTTHRHDFTGDGHSHEVEGDFEIEKVPGYIDYFQTMPAVGTTDFESHLPSFYTLAFIMKL